MPNVSFVISSNSKDQLGDLNRKFVTAINTLDGSTLRNNKITIHQVDFIFTERLFHRKLLKITKSIL